MRTAQIVIALAVSVPIVGIGYSSDSNAAPVALQYATATYSQPGGWGPGNTIDGNFNTAWAIARCESTTSCFNTRADAQTIVWETKNNLTVNATTPLEFRLDHHVGFAAPDHNLGRFRLSYTTDDRSLFADGAETGGDVTANWELIDPVSISSMSGETFTILSDSSVLVSGGSNLYSTYRIAATLAAVGITGFRLEALKDSSLPFGGPGRQATNGNFTLSEFSITPVPLPATAWLIGSGLLALLGLVRSNRSK